MDVHRRGGSLVEEHQSTASTLYRRHLSLIESNANARAQRHRSLHFLVSHGIHDGKGGVHGRNGEQTGKYHAADGSVGLASCTADTGIRVHDRENHRADLSGRRLDKDLVHDDVQHRAADLTMVASSQSDLLFVGIQEGNKA